MTETLPPDWLRAPPSRPPSRAHPRKTVHDSSAIQPFQVDPTLLKQPTNTAAPPALAERSADNTVAVPSPIARFYLGRYPAMPAKTVPEHSGYHSISGARCTEHRKLCGVPDAPAVRKFRVTAEAQLGNPEYVAVGSSGAVAAARIPDSLQKSFKHAAGVSWRPRPTPLPPGGLVRWPQAWCPALIP